MCEPKGKTEVFEQKAAAGVLGDVAYGGKPAENLLADLLRSDLGVNVNPQALRMWLRWRWPRITPLAHTIHNAI